MKKMNNSNLVDTVIPAYEGNYTIGRSGRNIEAITIHHMAGVLSAEQCGYIFQNPNRQASSHYGIGNDGRIGQYVNEENTAWTNSNWDSNCKSVTIETSNCEMYGDWKVSDEALNSLITLVADIAKRNNLGVLVKGQNLTWHSMFANTNCPGDYLLSKLDYIIEQANKINEDKPEPQPSTDYLNLNANIDSWRVYPMNVAPVKGNECMFLKPSKFGGLSYTILGYTMEGVAIIQTRDFGQVQIFIGAGTEGKYSITKEPIYQLVN